MGFGLIMESSFFSLMKEDNLVTGVSSVDSSTMNSGGFDQRQFLYVGTLDFGWLGFMAYQPL